MRFNASKIRTQTNEDGQMEIILTTNESKLQVQNGVAKLKQILDKDKELTAEIKQYRKSRSLDSNSYLWILCHKIAELIRTTKEEVYKKAIRDVGQFEIVPIKNEAVTRWIDCWDSKGLGWFAEEMEDSKLPGYKKVISYYGSSVYSTKEMSVLIDYIVDEAKGLDIEVMTPEQLSLLKQEWGNQKAS